MKSSDLSNCFSHFYPLTQFIFRQCLREVDLAWQTCSAMAPLLLTWQPEAERLLLVKGSDASWPPLAALNTLFVPTEIKPSVLFCLEKKNKKKQEAQAAH